MKHRMLEERFLGAVACCAISSMIMLSSTATPPIVPISKLPELEAGTIATVEGVVVDYWARDDGSSTFTIVDMLSDATARVIFAASEARGSNSSIHIGDEVAVTGEMSTQQSPPTLFARNDDVVLLRKAEFVLTVSILAAHWNLFLNDRFDVRGVIRLSEAQNIFRLVDESQNCGLLLECNDDISGFVGAEVSIKGCLVLDRCNMALVLVVESVSANR